ncbi:FAD-binding oxidoreductase [Sinomonas halotolerans]|uniref:FAD-binding oxidoreductase n=1 Tax=Sinomonas halotolerans TaxID=1644133 RepID=A0ABU9X2X0_9MICC
MAESLTDLPRRSVWHGWGDPALARRVPAIAWPFFKALRGLEPSPVDTPPVALGDVRLPEPAVGREALGDLAGVVGPEHVSTERLARIEHAGGKGYPDLFRLRTGDAGRAPDAVVFPGDAGQVAAVVAVCARHGIAVVPFGGGTSVVGGVDPERGRFGAVVSVDLRRLNRLLSVDPVSQTAVLQAGMRGPEVERALAPYGLTLGHVPQSYQQATVGGFLATRSAGQASSGYGRFEDTVVALRLATPTGEAVLGGRAPQGETAAGPRLIDAVIGSEGLLGIVTEVTVQLQRVRPHVRQESWAFRDTEAGFEAFRDMAQALGRGVLPDVSRLSDADETLVVLLQAAAGIPAYGYLRARGWRAPSLAVFQLEDADPRSLAYRRRRLARLLRAHGAVRMPRSIAAHWMSHRFRGPYQRDHLMDRGLFVETIETATTWGSLRDLYGAVQGAVYAALGEKTVLQGHISHLEEGGASLYFTLLARAEEDPIAQWRRLKAAAGDAIMAAGGTITHHHAVGTDHRPWIREELGDMGVRILRAVKDELDPDGIMNPGKLLPD